MAKSNIVIVGGGCAGVGISKALSAKLDHTRFNLVLVTLADQYVHIIAMLRAMVDSPDAKNVEENALVPFDNFFERGKGTVKFGKVVSIEKAAGQGGMLSFESGETMDFVYLVVATGSKWEGPLSQLNVSDTTAFKASLRSWREKFAKAKDIVLVGAGAVGLELAGELRDAYPSKSITILHNQDLPLNSAYPAKMRKAVLKAWEARNVQFILNDSLIQIPDDTNGRSTVTTTKGKNISADLFVSTRGGKPNSDVFQHIGSNVLDENGRVKVDKYLRLEGFSDIFVAGDVINWPETKQAFKTEGHSAVISSNILSLASGKEPKSVYKGTFEALFVTNGKGGGVGYMGVLWGIMFGNTMVAMAKSKNLFVDKARKTLGA